MSAPRIAIGGFLHETNTFAPTRATYDDFLQGGGWPAMAAGAAIGETMAGINVGISGFIEQAEGKDVFVHVNSLAPGVDNLVENQAVEFEVTEGQKGPQAVNVRPV